MKHKQIDVDNSGEVRENTLTYRGPSGRSGIRTGANPEYVLESVPAFPSSSISSCRSRENPESALIALVS
jgi:hypothetical protein